MPHRKPPRPAARGWTGAGLMIAVLVAVAAAFWFLGEEQPPAPAAGPQPSPAPVEPVRSSEPDLPPFHPSAESAKPFPELQDPSRFEIPVIARAYEIAHEIPEVLAQQPCYCNCGVFGHGSLLDCFATDHGAG